MKTPRHIPAALLLALALLLSVGCAGTATPYGDAEPGHGLLYRDAGQARSLAMDSHAQHTMSQSHAGTAEPWYIGRNDSAASVVYGQRHAVSESTLTLTRDGQIITGGRVYDRFNQTTYRRRVTRTRR